jgi:hypothetical protein
MKKMEAEHRCLKAHGRHQFLRVQTLAGLSWLVLKVVHYIFQRGPHMETTSVHLYAVA